MYSLQLYDIITGVFSKIKDRVEAELIDYLQNLDRRYSLSKISPLLFKTLKDFVLRPGKRVRPVLFIIGYLGFARKACANLYKAAISFELLHDFMLVHDDIIDKAAIRRGRPSVHKMLDNYLKRFKEIKFNGQDLAIIAGDVMSAMAMDAFLSIKERATLKEKALKMFIEAGIYTEAGEFLELLTSVKEIEKITRQAIYRIYDYKTAYYSFAYPLSCGATLAEAGRSQIDRLYKYGIYLGRGFQVKDDILGMFGEEKKTGKSSLTDLQEAKKTTLIWYAYNNSDQKNRLSIKKILTKDKVDREDLLKMRRIITASGALDYARKDIGNFSRKACLAIKSSGMRAKYKTFLINYSRQLLSL